MKYYKIHHNLILEIENDTLTLKKRIFDKSYSLILSIILTPILIFYLFYLLFFLIVAPSEIVTFIKSIFLSENYIFIFACVISLILLIILSIISPLSLFWIPSKFIIKNNILTYFPYPFIKLNYNLNDVSFSFIKNETSRGYLYIFFKEIFWQIIIDLQNHHKIILFNINSNIIPSYYIDVVDKINNFIKNIKKA